MCRQDQTLLSHPCFASNICENDVPSKITFAQGFMMIPHPVCYEWSRTILLFKERLLECEPIDLGRFVVDLREGHLDYWTPSGTHPRVRNSKSSTYHQWCALPTKRALVTHSLYTLPRYMLLDLPRDIIRSVSCSRLRAHTLRIETVTWTHNTSPTSISMEAPYIFNALPSQTVFDFFPQRHN